MSNIWHDIDGAKLTYSRAADGGTVATVTFYNTLTSP